MVPKNQQCTIQSKTKHKIVICDMHELFCIGASRVSVQNHFLNLRFKSEHPSLASETMDIITADTKDKQNGQVEEYERQAHRQRAHA